MLSLEGIRVFWLSFVVKLRTINAILIGKPSKFPFCSFVKGSILLRVLPDDRTIRVVVWVSAFKWTVCREMPVTAATSTSSGKRFLGSFLSFSIVSRLLRLVLLRLLCMFTTRVIARSMRRLVSIRSIELHQTYRSSSGLYSFDVLKDSFDESCK